MRLPAFETISIMLSSCTSESPVFGVLRLKPRLISTARLAVVCCRALICAREWQHSMAKRTSCVYCLIFRPRLGWVGGGGGGRILSLKDHQSDCVSAPPPRSGIKIIKKVRFRAGGRGGAGAQPIKPPHNVPATICEASKSSDHRQFRPST